MSVITEKQEQSSPADTARAAPQRAGQPAPFWRANPRFYVCLTILLVSAVTMETVAQRLGVRFSKLPVPLKRALVDLDLDRMAPEYDLHPQQPPPIDEETLESLGTDEYWNWLLVDSIRPRNDPLCVAHVFVTYHTGRPDLVPHVPDECRRAAGYDPIGRPQTEYVQVANAGAPDDRVPVRVLTFRAPKRDVTAMQTGRPTDAGPTVMYLFHTNGRYATTRNEVRAIQASIFDRYAYYAKIEVSFSDYSFRKNPTREESLAALAPLLQKVLPALLEDHFQDWETLTSGAETEVVENQEQER